MNVDLTPLEQEALAAFQQKRAVQKILKNNGKLALVFDSSSGIGCSVEVTVRDKDGNELRQDITDYLAW